jgi:hypothetical protein
MNVLKTCFIGCIGFILVVVASASPLQAEELAVTASLDRNSIGLEDQAVLTISVSGANDASTPTLPDLPDFGVVSSGRSTRVSIVNGNMSSQTDYNYALQPRKAGDLTIGPVTVQYKGKIYRSQPVIVHVAKSGRTESGSKDLFITTEVNRTSPYVGEQLLFRLKFFRRINVAEAALGEFSFDGFQTADAGKETSYTTVVDGVNYQVTEIRKLLIPSRAGKLTIPAATLQCRVPAEGRPRVPGHPFGDDFFNFGMQSTVTKALHSQPLAVNVRSLPQEGRPTAFSGMVGVFKLSAELDKKEVKKGESATLTIRIAGRGDLSGAPRPALRGIEQFKAYDDQPVTSKKIEGEHMVSEKTFKTALVPGSIGDIKLSEISFWYFDPEAGSYKKASASAPGLRVVPSGERSAEGQEPAALKQSVQLVGKDILPINTDLYLLRDETFRPASPAISALFLAPPLAFFGIYIFKKRRDRFATDIGFRRSSKAMKQAQKGLEEAGRLARNNETKACCSALSRTVKTYLGDKLNVSGEMMTPDEIKEALRARTGEGPLADRTVALLRELEMRQFAPSADRASGTETLLQDALDALRRMEKLL